ncbi:Quinone oxidoreductase 1 [Hartmannibacter diazotrophicus]|uniref:Quinone oxidoreductase 1 n=1 Tax=Hartmannibacter diazotrophicus TaxID=1482074 RepID=A0A2C9D0V3_9HYPH|nr:quinone oxidoreductase [Hartmannibacter diazotrophicus]SON53798.1 Quinone oxidoreductase 1 [Hartmannibacter diazotrophicus]
MDKAIRLSEPGGVDRLTLIDWPAQEPGPGEVRLRHEAVGVNFIDVYHRTGLYPLPEPRIPGVEGAGIIEAVGEGVEGLTVGVRVAYAGAPGAYAATRLLPAWRAIPLTEGIPAPEAAVLLLRGLTVHMLLTRTCQVREGTALLVLAAAGGLGSLLTRWAKHLGATVIGTVGSKEKAEVARAHGADHVIVGRDADIAAEVMRLTDGVGVDFAVDGIGGDQLLKTFACVRRFGTVASIGQTAGPIPPVPVEAIGPLRSLVFARPSVMAYSTERDVYPGAAREVIEMARRGIGPAVGQSYPLEDAGKAQADLEAGRTVGSPILIP